MGIQSRIRPHLPWLAISLIAIVIIAVAHLLMPPYLRPVIYILSLILGAFVSPIVSEFLPANIRERMTQFARGVRQRLLDPDTDLIYTTRYTLDQPVELEQFKDDLQAEFGVAPTADEYFTFNKKKQAGKIEASVRLSTSYESPDDGSGTFDTPPSLGSVTESAQSTSQTQTITLVEEARVKLKMNNVDYNDFELATDTLQDLETRLVNIIHSYSGKRASGVGLTIQLHDGRELDSIIPGTKTDDVRMTTQGGLDVSLEESRIQIEDSNDTGSELVFDAARQFLLFFSEP